MLSPRSVHYRKMLNRLARSIRCGSIYSKKLKLQLPWTKPGSPKLTSHCPLIDTQPFTANIRARSRPSLRRAIISAKRTKLPVCSKTYYNQSELLDCHLFQIYRFSETCWGKARLFLEHPGKGRIRGITSSLSRIRQRISRLR
jgi:hypothetical protein